jgi:hypothetical protein
LTESCVVRIIALPEYNGDAGHGRATRRKSARASGPHLLV